MRKGIRTVARQASGGLAAIHTAAATLNAARNPKLTEVPWTMVDEIQEATRRLNRLVSNLLNMTRLESGHVKPNLDWCDVADLVQVTLKEIEKDLASDDRDFWVYTPSDNSWRKVRVPTSGESLHGKVGQNRAMLYDAKRDLLLLVLGGRGGDVGQATVYALRYRHGAAQFVTAAAR